MPVKVAVRSRPLMVEGHDNCVELNKEDNSLILGHEKSFTFDYVFDDLTSNDLLYEDCISNIVDDFVKGQNATVLAYGQTGSGKTFTMGTNYCKDIEISKPEIGVIPRVLKHIFEKHAADWKIEVSFLEIYNEVIYDILGSMRQIVQLQERKNVVKLKNLSSNSVSNLEESLNYLEQGSIARTTGSTAQNENSSRSHAIFIINLTIGINKSYKLYLVDLAGSEGVRKSQTVGQRQREGININRGLLSLGKVLTALSSKNPGHIPYRDSVLTRMLKDSLNGVSNTLMIACVNPDVDYLMETTDTLRYASFALNIPSVNLHQTSFMKENNPFRPKLDKIPPTPAFLRSYGSFPHQIQARVSSTPAFNTNGTQAFCPLSAIKPTSDFVIPKPPKQKQPKETDFTSFLSPLAKRVHGMLEKSVFKKLDYMESVRRSKRSSCAIDSNIPDHLFMSKRMKSVREATNCISPIQEYQPASKLNLTFSPDDESKRVKSVREATNCISPIQEYQPVSKLNLTFSPDDKSRQNSRSKSKLNVTFSPEKPADMEGNRKDEENIEYEHNDENLQMQDFSSPLAKKVQTLMEATIFPKIEKYFQSKYRGIEPEKHRASPRLTAKKRKPVTTLSDVTNNQVNFVKVYEQNVLDIINNGSSKKLKTLPCIGDKTAQTIILHRQLKGKIDSLLDLKTVIPQKSFLSRFLKANCLDILLDKP